MGLLGLLGLLLKACWFEKGFDMIWPTQTGGSKFNLQMNQWRFESCLQTDNSRHRNQERPYTIQQSLKDIPSSNGAVRFCNPSLHNVCSCSRDNPSSNAPPMGYPAHHDRFLAFVPFSITTLFFIVPFQMLTSARAFAKSSLSAWAGLKQAAPGFHRLLGSLSCKLSESTHPSLPPPLRHVALRSLTSLLSSRCWSQKYMTLLNH